MGVAVAQPVSPELVLVCPELRAHALALLPALDPDALFEVAPLPLAQVIELRPGAPERRRTAPVAVAAYVAEALLFGALRGASLIAAIACIAFLLAR